ncbi:hypothetical protein E9232_002754 [Inquilinus ginsengisoli]|uniref:Uncharacterized protein n=1 Tax=Inquilinus ginsengisoli TaxID=363840 RepID=A0ABU1JNP1_9PROT|nr:hypothetical protein [Inquilinus ginsengisoli]MDR6290233.1 hypothetical protein [Inquilinus ginsengisoli]
MDKPQTARTQEAAPQEDRAARHLRLLARAAEIQMEVMEATRDEAVQKPQSGIDYCQRIAVATRSLRLTLLLEEEMARPPEERAAALAKARPAASPMANWHEKNATLGVAPVAVEAAVERTESEAASCLRAETVERPERHERLERPEVVERVERCPMPKARPTVVPRWAWHHERVKLAVVSAADDGSGSEESDRLHARVCQRLEQPEVAEMIERSPAPEAVARLCRELGLPPEADRWLELADEMLEEEGFIPEPEAPPATPARQAEAPDTG